MANGQRSTPSIWCVHQVTGLHSATLLHADATQTLGEYAQLVHGPMRCSFEALEERGDLLARLYGELAWKLQVLLTGSLSQPYLLPHLVNTYWTIVAPLIKILRYPRILAKPDAHRFVLFAARWTTRPLSPFNPSFADRLWLESVFPWLCLVPICKRYRQQLTHVQQVVIGNVA